MSPSATSLAVTVAHAATYLTNPLSTRLSPHAYSHLQSALEASLTSSFLASWNQEDPTKGAGRRVLSFTPGAAPPRPVYAACEVAQIPWDFWADAIKHDYSLDEFDLCVDPGSVSLKSKSSQSALKAIWSSMAIPAPAPASISIWSAAQQQKQQQQFYQQQQHQAESSSPKLAQLQQLKSQAEARSISRMHTPQPVSLSLAVPQLKSTPKTLAQKLMEDDDADDEVLFSMLAAEMRAPTWKTPVLESFPSDLIEALPPVPAVPQNLYQLQIPTQTQRTAFGHSRSSSRSSVASSLSSLYSSGSSSTSDDAMSSCSSLTSLTSASTAASSTSSLPLTAGTAAAAKKSTRNRRERVFIDTTKTEVTPYDGGKTTVLTGGVMLGAAPAKNSRAANGRRMPRF